jgi:hypothetical protein
VRYDINHPDLDHILIPPFLFQLRDIIESWPTVLPVGFQATTGRLITSIDTVFSSGTGSAGS